MKKTINLTTLVLISALIYSQNPVLHWRFANPVQLCVDTNNFFQFDVEVSCDYWGTYHHGLNEYIRYDTITFGSYVVSSGAIIYEPLELLEGNLGGWPLYNILLFVDNKPDIFALISEAGFSVANPMFMNEVPMLPNFGGVCRFTIKIKNANFTAGIGFVPEMGGVGLMDGNQYYLDATHPAATKYGNPPGYEGVYENDLLNWPIQSPHASFLTIQVRLEGAFDTTLHKMRTKLFSNGDIPLSQPYGPSLPYYNNPQPSWYYLGAEAVSTIPANIVDWVVMEIRDAPDATSATSATSLGRQACFLRDDGMVVGGSGDGIITFYKQIYYGMFVVMWHRNHLQVMNAEPIPPLYTDCKEYYYDFSTGSGQAFGGILAQHEAEPGVWAMIAADGNADGQVGNPDKIEVWAVDAAQSGYLGGDFNLDGQCNSQDKVDFLQVNSGSGSQVPQ
ncbi:MAG: hypothetical protein JXA03_15785 [Bacteroidales bacterium]|nr:hypothetical protein [Bacteroidales bacterium]